MNHLKIFFYEIKLRFLYFMISFIFTFILIYSYQIETIYIIGHPFFQLEHPFIFTDLTEAFSSILRICFFITLITLIPFFLYHIWSFIIPSSYYCERKWLIWGFLLFIALCFFEIYVIYNVLIPNVCNFLLNFELSYQKTKGVKKDILCQTPIFSLFGSNNGLDNFIQTTEKHQSPCILLEIAVRIESYLKLTEKIFCLFLILFQIPFFFVYLYRKKYLNSYDLCQNRKNFLFISLLLSASVSPPDIYSQFFITFLLFFIYEICIFIGLFFYKE